MVALYFWILEFDDVTCIRSILGINRNNDVILPLETNMASSWQSVERRKGISWSRDDTLLLRQRKGAEEDIQR